MTGAYPRRGLSVSDTCHRVTCSRVRNWACVHTTCQSLAESCSRSQCRVGPGTREALGQRQAMVSSWRRVGHLERQCERGRRKQPVPVTAPARVQEIFQMSPPSPQIGVDGKDLHPGFICPIRIGFQHMALVSRLCQSRS